MARRAILVLCAAVLVGGAVAGWSEVVAQEKAVGWEHGIFQCSWRHVTDADRWENTYRWITGAEEEKESDVGAIWDRLGIQGSPRNDVSDRVCVLDHLSSQGWVLLTRSDVSLSGMGGAVVAENYVLRRRR